MCDKTTFQFQIKRITDDYLQRYKTLKLFTNTFTFNRVTNIFTSIKVILKNMYKHKVIKIAKRIKAWIKLKLFIVLGLMK